MASEWRWQWIGEGTDDVKVGRGRVYYEKLSGFRLSDDKHRVYEIGDVVVMNGENAETWIAQIVEMFQVEEDDAELQEILRLDSTRNDDSVHHYELMRVTLRWFYNRHDVSKDTLRRSKVPKPIPNEFYFSDHVEKDGYNDVTVIEGLAFLLESASSREAFLRDRDPRYDADIDRVGIVRCFLNSNVDDYELRQLDKGELSFLLKNPSKAKNLFDSSRQLMLGKGKGSGPILKGIMRGSGKKRKRVGRSPVDLDDEEYEPEPEVKKIKTSAKKKRQSQGSAGSHSRQDRRRKTIVDEDDDETPIEAHVVDDSEDDIPLMDLSARQAQELNRANDEVLDLVSELNANVGSATADDSVGSARTRAEGAADLPRQESMAKPTGAAPGKASPSKSLVPSETIVIDDDGDTDNERSVGVRREALKPIVSRRERATAVVARRVDKPRPSFMPTSRDRKPAPEPKEVQKRVPPKQQPDLSLVRSTEESVQKAVGKKDTGAKVSSASSIAVRRKQETKSHGIAKAAQPGVSKKQSPQAYEASDLPEIAEAPVRRRLAEKKMQDSDSPVSTSTPPKEPSPAERAQAAIDEAEHWAPIIRKGSPRRKLADAVVEDKKPCLESALKFARFTRGAAFDKQAEDKLRKEVMTESYRKKMVGQSVFLTTAREKSIEDLGTADEEPSLLPPQDYESQSDIEPGPSLQQKERKERVSLRARTRVAERDPTYSGSTDDTRTQTNENPESDVESAELDRDVDMRFGDDDSDVDMESDFAKRMVATLKPVADKLVEVYPLMSEEEQNVLYRHVEYMYDQVMARSEEGGGGSEEEQCQTLWTEIRKDLCAKLASEGLGHLATRLE